MRDRLIRCVHSSERSGDLAFDNTFYSGGTYCGNFRSFIDWSAYYFGAYSIEELDLLADLLQPLVAPVVLDIGANAGNHTLFLARRSAQLLAFEPFPEAIAQLRHQLEVNQLRNVTVVPCGLGSSDAELPYRPPSGSNRGVGSFVPGGGEAGLLAVRQGDHLLDDLGITSVQLIKVDTEGFEVAVLQGLRRTLERDRPVVLFEWTQAERSTSGLNTGADLFPAGYQFSQVLPPAARLGILSWGRYRLQPLRTGKTWPTGNLLAQPA